MLDVTFEKIISLIIQHEYFLETNNWNQETLEALPTLTDAPTELRVHKQGASYSLFWKNMQQGNSELEEQAYSFIFPIQVRDQHFFNYTNIDFQPNKVFYLDYQNTSTLNAEVGAWMEVKNKRFIYALPAAEIETLTTIQLKKMDGAVRTLLLPEAPFSDGLQIDLSGEPDGCYQLTLNFKEASKDVNDTFFCSDTIVQHPANIILTWRSTLTNKNTPLTLFFAARPVYIKYFFMGIQNKEDWEQATISSFDLSGKTVHFIKSTTPETLENGQVAYTAVTDQPVPLLQYPNWKIKYQSSQMPQGFDLPYPSPDRIQRDEQVEGQARYLSPIYVYT